MARLTAAAATGFLTVALAIVGSLLASGVRLGAVETRTTRNEQDIRALQTEIRDQLRIISVNTEECRRMVERMEAEQRILHGLRPEGFSGPSGR